jgi:hypothetical protein
MASAIAPGVVADIADGTHLTTTAGITTTMATGSVQLSTSGPLITTVVEGHVTTITTMHTAIGATAAVMPMVTGTCMAAAVTVGTQTAVTGSTNLRNEWTEACPPPIFAFKLIFFALALARFLV